VVVLVVVVPGSGSTGTSCTSTPGTRYLEAREASGVLSPLLVLVVLVPVVLLCHVWCQHMSHVTCHNWFNFNNRSLYHSELLPVRTTRFQVSTTSTVPVPVQSTSTVLY
jgi:hypothetical protein